jgi:dihydrodipicolinate synthase/N-acetylneuraminate lyase
LTDGQTEKHEANLMDDVTFDGILPAMITPFTPDGASVDHAAYTPIVDRLVAAGVAGLVPNGSTGEFNSLTGDERRATVESIVAAAAGRVPVVPQTGAMSTAETVALSVHAEQAGAAAVMVVPPFYEPISFPELLAHFAAVSDAISLPIMYYNIPPATGLVLDAAQFAELAAKTRVTMLKDTSGNAVAATELIQTDADGPTLLNGIDTLTFAALAAGARAAVWGAASFVPDQAVELHRLLVREPDLVAARALWAKIWPICDFLESHSYCATVKAGSELVGLPAFTVAQ